MAGEGNYHFVDCREHSLIDLNRASALAEVMKAGFQFGRAKILTNTPARRINFRSVIRHSARIYLHTVQAPAGRRPRVRFYHDCSGSMRGNPGELGLVLLTGLNLLAEEGIIDATLTLTMGLDSGRGITACRETFALPAPLAVLETIPACGGCECFFNALRATESQLEAGDLVLLYTDGNITDHEIDRSSWHRRGLFSVGLYVGDDCTEDMSRWFDLSLCRDAPEGLALELAELLKERTGRSCWAP